MNKLTLFARLVRNGHLSLVEFTQFRLHSKSTNFMFHPVGRAHAETPIVLSNAQVCSYFRNIADLVPPIEKCLVDFSALDSEEQAKSEEPMLVNPLRTTIAPSKTSFFMSMPVFYRRSGVFTCKLVSSVLPNIPNPVGPVLNVVLALFDSVSGVPLAFMEAEELTGIRTSLVSYLTAKYLMRDTPKHVCIIGTGTQAASHLQVVAALLKPEKVFIASKELAWAEEFCEKWRKVVTNTTLVPCATAKEACATAEFVITVTNSPVPVLYSDDLSDACRLITIVGAPVKTAQEAETKVLKDALAIYADSSSAASNESGDVINSGRSIDAELGEIIAGTKKLAEPVSGKKPYVVFKSQGLAVEDAVTAKFVYEQMMKNTTPSA